MQEDKRAVFHADDTLALAVPALGGLLETAEFHPPEPRSQTVALDLAEALVGKGVPFREAHEAVGRVVAHCLEKDLDLCGLSREDLRAFHDAFPAAAGELLSLARALEARDLPGGTARATVAAALAEAESEVREALEALGRETPA